jgi:hypothetical protein
MSDSKQHSIPAGMFSSRWRWLVYLLGSLLLLVVLYGLGRLGVVALGSFYSGERGPYLQQPAPTAMTLRWQTSDEEVGEVRYGYKPDQLQWQAKETQAGEEHEVRLTGLQPATRYYYALGTTTTTHYEGKDYWFNTPPLSGTPAATRFVVLGDPGYPNPGQVAVRDAIQAWLDANPRAGRSAFDLLLTTGDNAYRSGTNEQFQAGFFTPYASWLRNVPVWPIYGNHDARRWAFFDLFSFPANGESGGLPSKTEHYYAFDYGQVHFIILDTEASSMRTDSSMLRWLEADLAKSDQPWLIVAFHHPPYTHGSHNSDSRTDSGRRLFKVREEVLPLLEKAGVDLVLSGHSHMYERSHLLGCHYGTSDTLEPKMWQKPRMQGKQAIYTKQAAGRVAHQGAIYAVVGSSSKADQGPLDHPVMAVSQRQLGALVVDINGSQLTGRFINEHGVIADYFTIIKGDGDAAMLQCSVNNE